MNKLWYTFENLKKIMETFPEKFACAHAQKQAHKLCFTTYQKCFKTQFPFLLTNLGRCMSVKEQLGVFSLFSMWKSLTDKEDNDAHTTQQSWEREREREQTHKLSLWTQLCLRFVCPTISSCMGQWICFCLFGLVLSLEIKVYSILIGNSIYQELYYDINKIIWTQNQYPKLQNPYCLSN